MSSDEERSLAFADSPSPSPKLASGEPTGDLPVRGKLSPDTVPATCSEDGGPSNEELNKDLGGGCKNEKQGGGEGYESRQRSPGEAGTEKTNLVSIKDTKNDDNSNAKMRKEGVNGDKSEEEESSNGRERRRRRNGYESSSEEDSFADALDDVQDVTNASKTPPDEPLHREQEGRTPQSDEGRVESDDRTIDGDNQEWDQGSEERGDGNLDWANKDEQDLDHSLSYDGEQLEEAEEGEPEDKSGEEPEDEVYEEKEEISKDSPMYVPKGVYFQHDSRSEEQENEKEAKNPEPQSRSETAEKWEHDLYIEEEQKPRTQQEKDRDFKRLDDLENRRSQNTRSRGTLGEYIPSRRRRDDRVSGRYNNRYTPRDRQPNHNRSPKQGTEKDEGQYDRVHPQRANAGQRARDRGRSNQRLVAETKGSGAVRSRDRETSDWRPPDETKRSGPNRNKDQRSINRKAAVESWDDNVHLNKAKEPPLKRTTEEARKSPRPATNNARNQLHTLPADRSGSAPKQSRNDSKEPVPESLSLSNANGPKSLFQQHGDAPRNFSNSRVFTLDQRSQRVTVKELELPLPGSSQQSQLSSRVRRPLGRGRGIIKRGGDSTPGNRVGSTVSSNVPASPPPSSDVKEIAPFDQRVSDEGNTRQTPKTCVSHPCKSQASSDRALQEALLSQDQEDKKSPKKAKEKESILGEPPPSVSTGKPKRYSSQRQKPAATAQEELVADEPSQLDYSQPGPTPWMVPFPMMDPTAIQRQAMAIMHSQQLAQQMAFFQQQQQQHQLRLMHEYQQATPPPPPPVGPHNAPYPIELPPPMMPYLPPVPPQPVLPHPEGKVPIVPMGGTEPFPEQGGLFIPGVNPDQQRFYHLQGSVPKHSQAIPIVPPAEQNL